MRVIKHGKLPEYKYTCCDCNSEFIFDRSDIRPINYEFGWITCYKMGFNCPTCNRRYQFSNMSELDPYKIEEEGE